MSNTFKLKVVTKDDYGANVAATKAVPLVVNDTQAGRTYFSAPSGNTLYGSPLISVGEPVLQVVPAPIITAPLTGAVLNPIMTVTTNEWSHLYRRPQMLYRILVARDEAMTDVVQDVIKTGAEISEHQFGLYDLPGSTDLYIRVFKAEYSATASDHVGDGTWSAITRITTLQDPYIYKPTVSVTLDTEGTVYYMPTFTSSTFQYWGVHDQTHVSTIWYLTDTVTGVVTEKVTTGTTVTWDALVFARPYTIACAHTGDTLRPSERSDPVSFTVEAAPHTRPATITYPIAGGVRPPPYIVVTTDPIYTARDSTPVAARYAIYANDVLIADVVKRLTSHTAPIAWADNGATITDTQTVTSVSDLYGLDYGLIPYTNLGKTVVVKVWHVDAVYGPSTDASGVQTPGSVSVRINGLYRGGLTYPLNGTAGVGFLPTITHNVTAVSWTLPLHGEWHDVFEIDVAIKNDENTLTVWHKRPASGSETSTVTLAENTYYRAFVNCISSLSPHNSQVDTTRFSTYDAQMTLKSSAVIYPTHLSTDIPLQPTVRIPGVTLVNTAELAGLILTVDWAITDADGTVVVSETTTVSNTSADYFEWTPALALNQYANYTVSATYKTNKTAYVDNIGPLSASFLTIHIGANAPTVSTVSGSTISLNNEVVTITPHGIWNNNDVIGLPSWYTYTVTGVLELSLTSDFSTLVGSYSWPMIDLATSYDIDFNILGGTYSTGYYMRARLVPSDEDRVVGSTSATVYVTTAARTELDGNTAQITSPAAGSVITTQTMSVSTLYDVTLVRVRVAENAYKAQILTVVQYEGAWYSAKANTSNGTVVSYYLGSIGVTVPASGATVQMVSTSYLAQTWIGEQIQISASADFSTLVYDNTTSVKEGWSVVFTDPEIYGSQGFRVYHPEDWGPTPSTYSEVYNGSRGFYMSPTFRDIKPATVDLSALSDGVYYVRSIIKFVSASNMQWVYVVSDPVRFTYAPTIAKKWGGVFRTVAETSYYMQGVYGNAGLCMPSDTGVYNLSLYSITDSVSQTRIYRSSKRWYFSFTPSQRYIGVTAKDCTLSEVNGTLSKPGLLWYIPCITPLQATSYTTSYQFIQQNGPVGSAWHLPEVDPAHTYRGQGTDDWWAVVDLDRGHVEFYYPTGVNAFNVKIPNWTAGLEMTLSICTYDYSVSQTIGERSRVFYDTVTTAPDLFATVQTNFSTLVYYT